MYQCFQMLGYKPYHMYECVKNGITHMSLLNEALRNKYLGKGKPYDKADFDKWLANYDVCPQLEQCSSSPERNDGLIRVFPTNRRLSKFLPTL